MNTITCDLTDVALHCASYLADGGNDGAVKWLAQRGVSSNLPANLSGWWVGFSEPGKMDFIDQYPLPRGITIPAISPSGEVTAVCVITNLKELKGEIVGDDKAIWGHHNIGKAEKLLTCPTPLEAVLLSNYLPSELGVAPIYCKEVDQHNEVFKGRGVKGHKGDVLLSFGGGKQQDWNNHPGRLLELYREADVPIDFIMIWLHLNKVRKYER